MFPNNKAFKDSKRANSEREGFVRGFLRHLMDLDGPNSSLRVFCRVDIGIFVDRAQEASYFVNEVERGITTSLWANSGTDVVGRVGASMVEPLKRWIAAEKLRVGCLE